MLANIQCLPRQHWHGFNSSLNFRFDIKQTDVDLAAVNYAVEKRLLADRQVEQETKTVLTEQDGLIDPPIDIFCSGKVVMRQAYRELLTKLLRVAVYGINRHGSPIAPRASAQGQHSGFDPTPVEVFNRQDTTRVE